MNIKYNGEFTELSCDIISLHDLVNIKITDKEGVIAMVNQHHIRPEEWTIHILNEGDTVEFFTLTGGG